MNTKDVRIDVELNKFLWSRGIAKVPRRVRIRCTRKLSETETDEEKDSFYTLVSHVHVTSFKGLTTQAVDEQTTA